MGCSQSNANDACEAYRAPGEGSESVPRKRSLEDPPVIDTNSLIADIDKWLAKQASSRPSSPAAKRRSSYVNTDQRRSPASAAASASAKIRKSAALPSGHSASSGEGSDTQPASKSPEAKLYQALEQRGARAGRSARYSQAARQSARRTRASLNSSTGSEQQEPLPEDMSPRVWVTSNEP